MSNEIQPIRSTVIQTGERSWKFCVWYETEEDAKAALARFTAVPSGDTAAPNVATINRFRELRQGWDSYNGSPIRPEAIEIALLLAPVLPDWQPVPRSDGGIQFEKGDYEINIDTSPALEIAEPVTTTTAARVAAEAINSLAIAELNRQFYGPTFDRLIGIISKHFPAAAIEAEVRVAHVIPAGREYSVAIGTKTAGIGIHIFDNENDAISLRDAINSHAAAALRTPQPDSTSDT